MSTFDAADSAVIAELAERIADLLADLLPERLAARASTGDVLTAKDVAGQYRVSVGWVYAHQAELGAERIGSGPKPRIRFRRAIVEERLWSSPSKLEPVASRRADPRPAQLPVAPVKLLPIRGRSE